MSEDERTDEPTTVNVRPTDEQPRPQINITSPFESPMADSYRDAKFRAWVTDVDARYLARQYAARHINRA